MDKFPSTYLGLPFNAKGSCVLTWDPIIKRFETKLAGRLSLSGRATVVKSLLAYLPNYYMSLFQISVSIRNKLEQIQRRFLWGYKGTRKDSLG